MADTNFIIDPDNGPGTDYTSLVTWESTEQTTISLGDRYLVDCRCTGGSADTSTSGCYINGWTINGELIIYTELKYRHRGIYPSSGNYYRLETNSSWMNTLDISENNVTINGIACKQTYSGGGNTCISSDIPDNLKIIACYSHGSSNGRCYSITVGTSGYTHYFINNFAYKGTYGFALGGVSGGLQYIYNNTSVDCSDDNYRVYGCTTYLKNNTAQDRNNYFYDAFGIVNDDTNHAETSGYIGAAMDGTIITGSVSFVDESNGNLNLEINDGIVKGMGLNLSNDSYFKFDYDFLNQKRGVYWDLGPHQVQRTNYNMII